MFGINDDDKARVDARQQSDSDRLAGEPAAKSLSDSPFDADYTPLSSGEPASRPVAAHTHQANTVPEEDLLQIKTQALQSLAPLVGHLDQSPEEKFKTTMMMIQASDNADLILDAYQAAKSIVDEKARAQALLDIINEINYFTQRGKN